MTPSASSRSFACLKRLSWLLILPGFAWSLAVAGLSGPATPLRLACLVGLGLVFGLVVWKTCRGPWAPLPALLFSLAAALGAALLVQPRNDREWVFDHAQLPRAVVQDDLVTLHNYRNCDWTSERDATPRWETRTFPLSALKHVDFIMAYWGSPHICHAMVTFDFGDQGRLCVSMESRREPSEPYDPVAGAFRRYELIYVFGDERDLVRLRTNFRPGNEVYLFRLAASPADARLILLDYLKSANELQNRPRWYHSLFTNCTTVIRRHAKPLDVRLPLDWRIIANGHVDEYLHELGYLAAGLPLADLKPRSRITAAARSAPPEEFSRLIRTGRPGF